MFSLSKINLGITILLIKVKRSDFAEHFLANTILFIPVANINFI